MTVGERIRRFFAPSTPWVLIFIVGVGIALGYAYYGNARTLRDEAIHESERTAAQDSARARCLENRPILIKFNKSRKGQDDFNRTVVENSARTVVSTPKSDPQYEIRLKNLRHLIFARERAKSLQGLPVPTKRECRALTGE